MRSTSRVRYSSRLIEVKLSIRKRSKMGGAHGPACAERLQRQAGSPPERERQRGQGSEISEKPPKLRLELQRRVPDRRTRIKPAQWSSAPQQRCRGANRWRCHWPAACDKALQHSLLHPQYMRRQHVHFRARQAVEMSKPPRTRPPHLPPMRNRHRT